MLDKVLTYTIEPSKGRQFAFGDIHGCYATLKKLLKKIEYDTSDQLFFLGDVINRGKRSKDVLSFIIKSQKKGLPIYALRGNHEEFLINHLKIYPSTEAIELIEKIKFNFIINSSGQIKPKYLGYFNNLPHYLELPTCFLVHAGFNFKNNPLTNIHDMLNIRDFTVDKAFLGEKKLIHGHTPIALSQILYSVHTDAPAINIDNGCWLAKKVDDKGHLVCIDLQTFEVFYQRNCES